jgi:arylsulfatase A
MKQHQLFTTFNQLLLTSLKNNLFYFSLIFFLGFSSCKKETAPKNISPPVVPPPASSKPNVIVILSDDIGYEVPSCDGGQSYSTPSIDQLAAGGMRFTQCHASPLCSPSRVMLLTGKYNFRNYTTWGELFSNQKTFANFFHDNGYTTCAAGKWQFDSANIKASLFGFNTYSLEEAFYKDSTEGSGSSGEEAHYKDPVIYQNGNYLADSLTLNKYSEDIFNKYVLNFIDSNTSKPFFIYYAPGLCHRPFSPTPLDPLFAGWNPMSPSDNRWFHEMVNYMDMMIGNVVQELKNKNLFNNTIILYSGDNGTPGGNGGNIPIYSEFDGYTIAGGKGQTIEYGTHVPLIVSWPQAVAPGSTDSSLVDFTDFFPTFTQILGVYNTAQYGILDGTSFYGQLLNISNAAVRSTIYEWYNPFFQGSGGHMATQVWAQNATYKLYATGNFFNIVKDVMELNPLQHQTLTMQELQAKEQLQNILNHQN